jgi:spore coat polysaccharide biosynthesis predicted glycosyltransferase SpsG
MGEYNSHLAVLPYLDDEKSIDDFCARDECQLAFGVKYFTANPRIVNAGRIARAYEAHGKNILVSISGTDPKAVTPRVLAAIQAMKAPELNVRILLSDAAAPELLAAVTATCQSNAQLEYCGFNESLADHLLWADLAILGEGHIKYDAAIVGTPCLIISQYDHDSSLVRSFYNLNCSIYLGAEGALDQKRLQVSIQSTLENLTLRQAMGAAGKTAIDGRGISRLYENHLRQILL